MRKLPKDRRKVRKGGKAAAKVNHEGGGRGKFWAIREESHRGRERAEVGDRGSPPKSFKGPIGSPWLSPENGGLPSFS